MRDIPKPANSTDREYQNYALIDPRDRTIRYVGISKDARVRPAQHLNEVENRNRAWLFDLKQQGFQPDIEILEIVTSDQDVISLALEREEYWIQRFLDAGARLTNIRLGNPQARHTGIQENEGGLNAKEACEYLGISRSTLERYAAEGLVTKYQRGTKRTVFFKQTGLDRLLEIHPDDRRQQGYL
jgi:excisionase family DNA binding protein